MMISRINSTYDNINTSQKSDSENNNLQTKLMAEQRRLKAVDSDTNMNAGDKAKEKLKIQQQIDEKAQEKSAASFGFTHHAQGSADLG